MTGHILVINPNSSDACTEDIDRALDSFRANGGAAIECLTLAEGPPAIECQRHVDAVVTPLCRTVESHDNRVGAYVIACFSDPGLHAVREATRKPVFGIAESGYLTALALGDQIGLIGNLAAGIPRHSRYIRALGIDRRFAGEVTLELGVAQLTDEAVTFERMTEAGFALRDRKGADVIVMGCAGMARYRSRLEDALDCPVVDPTQAAVGMAITASQLGYRTGPH